MNWYDWKILRGLKKELAWDNYDRFSYGYAFYKMVVWRSGVGI